MRPWQLLPVAWEAFQCNAMGSLRVHWSALGPAVVQPRSHWVPTSPIHTQPVTQPLRMSLLTDKPAPHFPSWKPIVRLWKCPNLSLACALRPAKLGAVCWKMWTNDQKVELPGSGQGGNCKYENSAGAEAWGSAQSSLAHRPPIHLILTLIGHQSQSTGTR